MPAFEDLWSPIRLTLTLASITTFLLLVVGTPIAWWLARSKAAWKIAIWNAEKVFHIDSVLRSHQRLSTSITITIGLTNWSR
jgi:ABC-type molybdate transport system permease subunit